MCLLFYLFPYPSVRSAMIKMPSQPSHVETKPYHAMPVYSLERLK